MAPKAKQATRRAVAKAKAKVATTSECELPGCENQETVLSMCCQRHICGACVVGMMRTCLCHEFPRFKLPCPFCRETVGLETELVKRLVGENCTDHCKVVEHRCSDNNVVVTLLPCPGGCYTCEDAKLYVNELVNPIG
jgi:hypothetical protein